MHDIMFQYQVDNIMPSKNKENVQNGLHFTQDNKSKDTYPTPYNKYLSFYLSAKVNIQYYDLLVDMEINKP